MKKNLLLVVCLFVFSVAVSAQQGQGQRQRMTPEESANRTTEWMKTELKLTDKQVTSVKAINLDIAKEQAKLRESANGDFSSIREASQKLETKRVAAFEKILTKDQLGSYKKLAAERQQRGPRQGQGGGGQR